MRPLGGRQLISPGRRWSRRRAGRMFGAVMPAAGRRQVADTAPLALYQPWCCNSQRWLRVPVCHTASMNIGRRAGFAAAQLGRKVGKREVLACLLAAEHLPGASWQVLDQRTWRTGVVGPATPWGDRARQAGSVTAWRSFRDNASRWAWIQITPWASATDADDALAEISGRGIKNVNAEVRLAGEFDPGIEPFHGAGSVWAREQPTQGPDGPGVVLMLAGTVGNWLAVVCLSDRQHGTGRQRRNLQRGRARD